MAEALVSISALQKHIPPHTAIELTQRALSANQALQNELTNRAEELEAEIREADRLLDTLENGLSLDGTEDEILISGARKATSLFPLSECLHLESPFREEALKRGDYLSRVTPHSFNPKQIEVLRSAVRSENQKLQAFRTQMRNKDPVSIETNVEGINWDIVAEKVSDASSDRFTADQCRIKWIGDKHPGINHSEWKAQELQRLHALVEDAKKSNPPGNSVNWVEIAKQLGTSRAALDVMNHGHIHQRHQWDNTSDKQLLVAVNRYGLNNWMTVAREVSEYATPTQCQKRYNKSLDPTIKRGAWTAVEDERLKKAVETFGSSWVRVAEYVPGRTNDQCNERWTGQLNANSSKNVWTDEEDKTLLELESSMGRQWKAISEKIGNGKTGPSCRLRYNKLAKINASTPASSYGHPHESIGPQINSSSQIDRHPRDQAPESAPPEGGVTSPVNTPSEEDDRTNRGKKRGRKIDGKPGDDSAPKMKKAKRSEEATDPPEDDTGAMTAPPAPKRVSRPRPTALNQKSNLADTPQTMPEESNSGVARETRVEPAPATTSPVVASPRRSARVIRSEGTENPR